MARAIGHSMSSDEAPQNNAKECWICLQSEEADLIAPCQCTGSMKWVHRACLNRWRVDATNPKNFTNCRHCNFKFRLVLQRDPTQDESSVHARKQRFLFKTVSNFIMMCTLLQVALVLLAMGIRLIDPKEELVKLLDFHQVEGTPPAGEGDYWNAIRHHKTTYYVTAVLAALFFTGAVATSIFACALCRRCDCDLHPGRGLGSDPLATYFCMRSCGDCCEWCGDCCFFCGRSDSCPDCSMDGTCLSDCCGTGNCDNCCPSSSGGGDPCSAAAVCLVIVAVVVIAFVLVGLILLFMALVAWLQKVVVRYLQISELRHLAGEYVVEDLSSEHAGAMDVTCNASDTFGLDIAEASAPLQENMDVQNAPAEPSSGGPTTDSHLVYQSLQRDLQAVYGRNLQLNV